MAPGWTDDGWTLQAIPYHVREVERGCFNQFEEILRKREPDIPHVEDTQRRLNLLLSELEHSGHDGR